MSSTQCERKGDLTPSDIAGGRGVRKGRRTCRLLLKPFVSQSGPAATLPRPGRSSRFCFLQPQEGSLCVGDSRLPGLSAPTYLFSLQSQESLRSHPALRAPA